MAEAVSGRMSGEDLRHRLHESKLSRLRAWRALQRIREIVANLGDKPLAPPEKPLNFTNEGEALRKALREHLQRVHVTLEHCTKYIEAMRPYMQSNDNGAFPSDLISFNRALGALNDMDNHAAYVLSKLKP